MALSNCFACASVAHGEHDDCRRHIEYQIEMAKYVRKKEECLQNIDNYIALLKESIAEKDGNMRLSEIMAIEAVQHPDSTTLRRSKSCSSVFVAPQASASKTCGRSQSHNRLETPANQPVKFSKLITPKLTEDAPFAVMRQPRQGEWAFSMDGSPLVGPSAVHGHCVNVNIATGDGNVVSILPQPGLKRAALPRNLPSEAKLQLQAIFNNLKTILQDEEH